MVYIIGRMVISMKVNGKIVKKKEMGYIIGKMVISMKDNGKIIK